MEEVIAAAVPVLRHTIVKEYADGDLALRVVVAAADVDAFWRWFPEAHTAAFLASERGAIEVIRDLLMGEYKDGSLAVKLLIAPKDKVRFRELWPTPNMAATLAREAPERGRQAMMDAAADEPPKYGQEARTLRTHINFLGNPKVWKAVGTDDEYLTWLRIQPCACCKWVPRWEMDSFVSTQAAHMRRVSEGAGVAIKPPYCAIPLCATCHRKQHEHGEEAIGGREWFERQRLRHVVEWVWEALKAQLGYEHWNLVPPETLRAWVAEHGLEDRVLPDCYRSGADVA